MIPIFPGTNCEDESSDAFERAGARVAFHLMRTADAALVRRSIRELATTLGDAQILFLPGGFSAADEPGGSGKYIAAVLRAAPIREVIEREFVSGDRLILGICNGFQGLVRTGLVPFGRYVDREPGMPVLAPNAVGRHVSRIVLTRLATSGGPWLSRAEAGAIWSVAISHGEGRYRAHAAMTARLFANGQVATQYVDWSGRVRDDRPWNPNGSDGAVEGLLSADGRFFGKMGHTERHIAGLYRHVPTVGAPDLFGSAVDWFA